MVIMVTLTPDGRAWEVSSEQADNEQSSRVDNGLALDTPDHWEQNKYILAMTMLDRFEANDKPNNMATIIYRNMRSGAYMPEDAIYGTVYIPNETTNEIDDFTMQYFMYMYNHRFKPVNNNGFKYIYRRYIYIHG